MRTADRIRAQYVYILGESELESGLGQLKNMATGEQKPVAPGELSAALR